MVLTPQLDSVEALYRKLEREMVRTFHQRNAIHKGDHFYNFCISAHSMRDYLLERLNKVDPTARQAFEEEWAREPVLVAVADIANTAKHFQLRRRSDHAPRRPTTQGVARGRTTIVDFYMNNENGGIINKRTVVPTYVVVLEAGQRFELYSFMASICNYWRRLLRSHGIRVRRQAWSTLHGAVPHELIAAEE